MIVTSAPTQAYLARGIRRKRVNAPKGPLETLSNVWKSSNGLFGWQYHAHFDCPRAEAVAKRARPFHCGRQNGQDSIDAQF